MITNPKILTCTIDGCNVEFEKTKPGAVPIYCEKHRQEMRRAARKRYSKKHGSQCNANNIRAVKEFRAKYTKDTSGKRYCLRCDKKFNSESTHNRICPRCKLLVEPHRQTFKVIFRR